MRTIMPSPTVPHRDVPGVGTKTPTMILSIARTNRTIASTYTTEMTAMTGKART
jgi:hypothetical protein